MMVFTKHAFQGLEKELHAILGAFHAMGDATLALLDTIEKGLRSGVSAHVEAKEIDKRVNIYEEELDGHVAEILGKYAPIGENLRFVISSPRIAASLERMGDMAKNTAKRFDKLTAPVPQTIADGLLAMIAHVRAALPHSLALIESFDEAQAFDALREDKAANRIFKELVATIEADLRARPEQAADTVQLLLSAKNLERMGDHAGNIAKVAYFIHMGHKPRKGKASADV